MDFHEADFCTKIRELPDRVSMALVRAFDRRFFWKAGTYAIKLSMKVDGTPFEKAFTFVVSQTQSEELRNVRLDLRNCAGIGIPLVLPDLDTLLSNRNFTRVPLNR